MEREGCCTAEDESDSAASIRPTSSHKIRKKRRFSEEQIRSLEKIFENETTRLEPRKKVQLARELGLHPRQIAIWFQNRRARWKTKRVEKEYGLLKADYDALLASFESLKQEKQGLLEQVTEIPCFLDSGCSVFIECSSINMVSGSSEFVKGGKGFPLSRLIVQPRRGRSKGTR